MPGVGDWLSGLEYGDLGDHVYVRRAVVGPGGGRTGILRLASIMLIPTSEQHIDVSLCDRTGIARQSIFMLIPTQLL